VGADAEAVQMVVEHFASAETLGDEQATAAGARPGSASWPGPDIRPALALPFSAVGASILAYAWSGSAWTAIPIRGKGTSSIMPVSQSANPKRRIAESGAFGEEQQDRLLAKARYTGSAIHKRRPADYGFQPPTNPRPHKSLCDDLRSIPVAEARKLFAAGVRKGMVSTYCVDGLPKYVWGVDDHGEAYEAKWDRDGYHGYRLDIDGEKYQRDCVLKAWSER
jgi:hypothetical protein